MVKYVCGGGGGGEYSCDVPIQNSRHGNGAIHRLDVAERNDQNLWMVLGEVT